jgi:hypothetical protein
MNGRPSVTADLCPSGCLSIQHAPVDEICAACSYSLLYLEDENDYYNCQPDETDQVGHQNMECGSKLKGYNPVAHAIKGLSKNENSHQKFASVSLFALARGLPCP